jgi:hypothetical protein
MSHYGLLVDFEAITLDCTSFPELLQDQALRRLSRI